MTAGSGMGRNLDYCKPTSKILKLPRAVNNPPTDFPALDRLNRRLATLDPQYRLDCPYESHRNYKVWGSAGTRLPASLEKPDAALHYGMDQDRFCYRFKRLVEQLTKLLIKTALLKPEIITISPLIDIFGRVKYRKLCS